jgi:hypothetical protein
MTLTRTSQNIALGLVLLSLPLIAEYWTATPQNVPGTGFSVLLYEPFSFAYPLLASLLFVVLNVNASQKVGKDKWADVIAGIFFTFIWFVIAFLAVGQFHLSLGGTL